jgi:hypothetical protein
MESIIETKKCRLTGEEFFITDKDMEWYKKYDISAPTLCPRELWRNLFAYRNERALFPRKCSKTGQNILSCYRENTIFPVYNHRLWWSDDWSAFEYGREFDFSKPYFEQYKSLQDVVPRVGTTVFNSENCDYNSQIRFSKDCYLCALAAKSEHAYYSYWTVESKEIFDSSMTIECENLHNCLDSIRCVRCVSCQECRDSQDCYFSYQLRNCKNCIACTGLVAKQYYIYNKPSTKEEYEKTLKLLKSSQTVWNQAKTVFEKIRLESIRPLSQFVNVDTSTGDHLQNCTQCIDCFDGSHSENCRHVQSFGEVKDSLWCYSVGFPRSESCAFSVVATRVFNSAFSFYLFDSKDLTYCDSCRNSSDLFGCIGVNHGQYAIMNKVYGQHEYETLRSKIIDHMKSTGEWGEFFPLSVAPHPYDDTAAYDFHPLTQGEVEKRGGRWGGELPPSLVVRTDEKPLHISQYDEKIVGLEVAQKNIDHILKTVFRCPISGKPFQIVRQELAFHIENAIPLPTAHQRVRHDELMKLRNPRELYKRKCGECGEEIQTSYTPERPEKVLCEACYMKHIY